MEEKLYTHNEVREIIMECDWMVRNYFCSHASVLRGEHTPVQPFPKFYYLHYKMNPFYSNYRGLTKFMEHEILNKST